MNRINFGRLGDIASILFAAFMGTWLLAVTILSRFYDYKATLHFNELNEWYADVVTFSFFTLIAIWRTFYWIRKYNEKQKEKTTI